jgi:CubicO group peptidase (beta-lactamase class C family)
MDLEQRVREVRGAAGVPALAAVRVSSARVEETALEGVRRADRDEEVEATDRFHIGSNTKAMTAMVAALAVERGAITWDTTAAEVLGVGAPTLRQLLTHASGLRPYGDDEDIAAVGTLDGTPAEQRAAFAARALTEEPLFEAGTRHEYSNAGLAVAAAMVEAATGQHWEDALRAELWQPLGMDARVGWPADHTPAGPFGHRLVDGTHVPHDPATDDYRLPDWMRPAGDVCASIGDYGIFLADQLDGLAGRGRLASASAYRYLHTPDDPDEADDVAYGLGWGVRRSATGAVSMHTGSAETFYAVVVLEPGRDRGMAVVANGYGEEQVVTINAIVKEFLAAD